MSILDEYRKSVGKMPHAELLTTIELFKGFINELEQYKEILQLLQEEKERRNKGE